MAAMAAPRKDLSIHDYPEHLNPFHEDDNHNKIRFWTLGRKLNRSNSISFSGIKDLKNSWAFRSFMKKGKKGHETSSKDKSSSQVNGDSSPIVYRRAMQYTSSSTSGSASRSTVGSPERYVYGGSITPLPRSRFQERMRSPSHFELNSVSISPRMARSEVSGSRLSVESTNPFDEGPVPPVRASRRKKKRAPQPPGTAEVTDVSMSSEISDLNITEDNITKQSKTDKDLELEEMNLNIELKIVEDEDIKQSNSNIETTTNSESTTRMTSKETDGVSDNIIEPKCDNGVDLRPIEKDSVEEGRTDIDRTVITSDSEHHIVDPVYFPKVDIVKYRRNSSVNEDDIRLRRGNLEDFHALTSKRSKSLNNNLDATYLTYNIDSIDDITNMNTNENEPHKVICKVYDDNARKQSIDTISSTEKEFLEIDKATRELEREISKLNSALIEDDIPSEGTRLSVSEIKRRFDQNDISSPNPIPKPRRSHYGGSNSP